MASFMHKFMPFSTYNNLPHIRSNDHSEGLKDLRKLLAKHNFPRDASIRLIHKHFDTQDGEVRPSTSLYSQPSAQCRL
ncbi:hypothetical protein BJ875DRAFT_458765 [Amylocarpus encephaloides]|uniref:Uncharacterized protein n=1 Tax=Amylocarpus encephaloides TaxID=45428 RepID=A0A9P7YM55_9HELO|nr:hypothetical protein BJ875DRAFT_458765 [Amylocarpus encephaloides]